MMWPPKASPAGKFGYTFKTFCSFSKTDQGLRVHYLPKLSDGYLNIAIINNYVKTGRKYRG